MHVPTSQTDYASHFNVLILDLGDVLFTWSAETKTSISPKLLKAMMSTTIWHDFESGRMPQVECFKLLGERFKMDAQEIAAAFDDAQKSLCSNTRLVSLVKELKQSRDIKVFAMSNISIPDIEYLQTMKADWDIFDEVFTSGHAGRRKPDLCFFNYVIEKGGFDPSRAVFIDDKLDNVLAARSVGMHGVVFQSTEQVVQVIQNSFCDPVARAWGYLKRHAGEHQSYTNIGVTISETFAQLLILEVCGDRSIAKITDFPRVFNFFAGEAELTDKDFPCDLDTTSLGWTIAKRKDDETVHSVMDEMLKYRNADGIVQVYFDHSRPRVDPVACVNVLSLFFAHGRGHELEETMAWIEAVLINRAYMDGTRYYRSPDSFLFTFSRLMTLSKDPAFYRKYSDLLRERLQESIGSPGDSLALAMRIVACSSVGLRDEVDLKHLLDRQAIDGGWDDGWFYKYPSSGILIGNKGLTTAFAMKAVEVSRQDSEYRN